jgi:DNA-binding response OmpR family regulator
VTDPRKKILLVDNSALMLETARDVLIVEGYEVVVAHTMAELEAEVTSPLDLILIEVQMPELFGDDVAMVLRSVRGITTPIYLLSGLDAEELETRAKDAGIEGYICKREGIDSLVRRVQMILGDE